MKKILFITSIALLGSSVSQAQQLSQYSQYLQNPYILNPATTGMYDYLDVNLSFRKQWAGFDASPQTAYLSAHGPLKKKPEIRPLLLRISQPSYEGVTLDAQSRIKHGLGGSFSSDEYGAFTNNTINLSYAIHLPIGTQTYLSFGLGGGVSMIKLDQSKVTLANAADNTYNEFIGSGSSRIVPDIKGGIYLYNDNFHLGYTSNQTLQSKVFFGAAPTAGSLKMHHFLNAGYKLGVSDNFSLTPGFLVKMMAPAPVSVDINLKAEFMEKLWLGASFRPNDAIVGMLGITLNDLLKFGYSYDYTTSELSNFNSGSHEIMLGVMLFK